MTRAQRKEKPNTSVYLPEKEKIMKSFCLKNQNSVAKAISALYLYFFYVKSLL